MGKLIPFRGDQHFDRDEVTKRRPKSEHYHIPPGQYRVPFLLSTSYLNAAMHEVFDDGDEEQAQRLYERAEHFNDIYQEGV